MLAEGETAPAAKAAAAIAMPTAIPTAMTIQASLLVGDDAVPDAASLPPQDTGGETLAAAGSVEMAATVEMPAIALDVAANDMSPIALPRPEIEAADAGVDADAGVEQDLPPLAAEDGGSAQEADPEHTDEETASPEVLQSGSVDSDAKIAVPSAELTELAVDTGEAALAPAVPTGETPAEPEGDTSPAPEARETSRADNRASAGGTPVRDAPTSPVQDGGFADALAPAPPADAAELSIAGSERGSAQDMSEAQRPEPRVSTAAGRLPQEMSVEIAKRIRNGDVELTVRLDPAELGRVEVKLGFDDGGVLRSVIAAESPAALELLRRDAADLARALQAAGVSTDAGSFRFDRQSRGEGQAPRQPDFGGRSDAARSLGEDAGPQPIRLAAGRVDILA